MVLLTTCCCMCFVFSLSLFFSIIHRSFSYSGWSSTTVTTPWIWIRFRNSRTIHAATWSGQPRTRSWNTGHGPGNSGCSPSSDPRIWSFNRFCWGSKSTLKPHASWRWSNSSWTSRWTLETKQKKIMSFYFIIRTYLKVIILNMFLTARKKIVWNLLAFLRLEFKNSF